MTIIRRSDGSIKKVIIDIWNVDMLSKYYGECWDCGHAFHKHQEIRIDEKDRALHRKCAKRSVWRGRIFSKASTILQRIHPYARTPLLFKSTDNVTITGPEGYEPMLQQFGTIVQFLGFTKNE